MAVQPALPGLFSKYEVRHVGGTTVLADCFVLRPTRDPAARAAVAAYAQAIEAENPELAADLHTWLGTIYGNLARGSAEFPMPADVGRMRAAYELEVQPAQWQLPTEPPAFARVDPCRSARCRAPVFFAVLLKKDGSFGKATPVDWPPQQGKGHLAVVRHQDGAVTIDHAYPVLLHEGKPVVRQTTEEERAWAAANGVVLYTGHFAWCPDADEFRGGGNAG